MVAEPLQQQPHQQPPHQHLASAAFVFASTAANLSSSNSSSPSLSPITGVGGSVASGQIGDPRQAAAGRVSPGLDALMQWIEESGGRNVGVVAAGGPGAAAAAAAQHQQQQKGASLGLMPTILPTMPMPPPQPALGAADGGAAARYQHHHQQYQDKDALDALMNATAIKNAVRLQPRGYRPGVMGGRVGLLEGLRTPEMDKYDDTVKPPKRRAPPSDLSGLSAEEIVARRNRLAREYSMQAHERRQAAVQMLEADAAALRVAREVMEMAPPGIAYLTLSGDMRGLVLYANGSAMAMLLRGRGGGGGKKAAKAAAAQCGAEQEGEGQGLLGRPFVDFVHPDDRAAWRDRLAVLVLNKNSELGCTLRFRLVCPDAAPQSQPRWVDAGFRFGAFGVACSLWTV